jgi:hypothetical protein
LQADHPENWSPYAGNAMAELLGLELSAAGLTPQRAEGEGPVMIALDPMLRFVLNDDYYLRYKSEQRDALQEGLDWAVGGSNSTEDAAHMFAADSMQAKRVLDAGAASLTKYWELRLTGGNHKLVDMRAVQTAVERFQSAEQALAGEISTSNGTTAREAATLEKFKTVRDAFLGQLTALQTARGAADAALARVDKDSTAGKSLLAMYQIEVDRDIEAARRAHEQLFRMIPKPGSSGEDSKVPEHLATLRLRLVRQTEMFPKLRNTALPEDLQNDLSRIDRRYLSTVKGADGREQRAFDRCAQIYSRAKDQLDGADRPPAGSPKAALDQLDAETAATLSQIEQLSADQGDGSEALKDAAKAARSVTEWAARYRRFILQKTAATGIAPRDVGTLALMNVSDGASEAAVSSAAPVVGPAAR